MSSMLSRSVVPEVLTTRTRTLPVTLRLVAVNNVNVVELAVKVPALIQEDPPVVLYSTRPALEPSVP